MVVRQVDGHTQTNGGLSTENDWLLSDGMHAKHGNLR
jgi:hypothetical protein